MPGRLRRREQTDTFHDPYVPAVFTLFPVTIHRSYNGCLYWERPTDDRFP